MDLDSVADELYGLRPSEFISARTLRASEAKKAGDRELSASIAGLKRPTKSAWLVNLLARQCGQQLTELLDLGEQMRAAQGRLAGAELRDIARRRRDVVATLTKKALQSAREAGEPVSDEMARELGSTLEAAFADRAARDAVRLGRLATALDYSGFGGIDQNDVPQQPQVARRTRTSSAMIKTGAYGQKPNIAEQRRRAKSRLADAQAIVSLASRDMDARERQLARSEKEKARLDKLIADREEEMSQLVSQSSRAAAELITAQQLRDTAQSSLEAAQVQVSRAKGELDDLET